MQCVYCTRFLPPSLEYLLLLMLGMFCFFFFSEWQIFWVRMHFCVYDGQRERERVRFKLREKRMKQKRVVCNFLSSQSQTWLWMFQSCYYTVTELTQNFEVEELVLMLAAVTAKRRKEGEGGWCLKWQDCITSQRGNRRKARKNGKQERRGRVTCAWHSPVFFFSVIFSN